MMKGADQCPKCGCSKWVQGWQEMPNNPFLASALSKLPRHVRVCKNCVTMWEFFDEADLLDAGERYSSFKEPCENCAFRPGSPEQRDPEKWKELLTTLQVDPETYQAKGIFFCHKGVPLDIHRVSPTDSGYMYPTNADGAFDVKRNRPCRGYYRMMRGQLQKIFAAEETEHEQAGLGHA